MEGTHESQHEKNQHLIEKATIIVTVVGCLSVVGGITIATAFWKTSWNTWRCNSNDPLEDVRLQSPFIWTDSKHHILSSGFTESQSAYTRILFTAFLAITGTLGFENLMLIVLSYLYKHM